MIKSLHKIALVGLLIDSAQADLISVNTVSLQALDKVTGSILNIQTAISKPVTFGDLIIIPLKGYASPPEDAPETVVFLEIREKEGEGQEPQDLFKGWMFASSPAICSLEHPVYDVWVNHTPATPPV